MDSFIHQHLSHIRQHEILEVVARDRAGEPVRSLGGLLGSIRQKFAGIRSNAATDSKIIRRTEDANTVSLR